MRCNVLAITLGLVLLIAPAALAANPPETINYQGVLRDSDGTPLNGGYRMVFRFYDADTGGSLLLTDAHDGTGGSSLVTVTNGLFDVWLGSGVLTPGEYALPSLMFGAESAVFLEVQVESDPPMTPRTRVLAAAYAFNTSQLAGRYDWEFLDTSSTPQMKTGSLAIDDGTLQVDASGGPLVPGLQVWGEFAGGVFHNTFTTTPNAGQATLASLTRGIDASGEQGGYFRQLNTVGQLISESYVAAGGNAVAGRGKVIGADMQNMDYSGRGYLAYYDYGVYGTGSVAGGRFDRVGIGLDPRSGETLTVAGTVASTSGGYKFPDNTVQTTKAAGDGNSLDAADGSPTDAVYVDSSGRVGVGTLAPAHALDVVGASRFSQGQIAVYGLGTNLGGEFLASGGGHAYLGGVEGYGGFFKDAYDTSRTFVADNSGDGTSRPGGTWGIQAFAYEGAGYFEEWGTGPIATRARLASNSIGIEAGGNTAGGYFKDNDSTGYAYVGYGDRGIHAYGTFAGGWFQDSNSSSYANVAYGDLGIDAHGSQAGGYFVDSDSTGYAYVGYGDRGIHAYGSYAGGWFQDTNSSSYANVAYGDRGIDASGSEAGGNFVETDSSASGAVAKNGYKLVGSGTNPAFVQNHPYDKSRVIVYTALEGDEVGTYTRGTARLAGGVAHVPLDGTFGWVTNPDIGLTAQVTPRGEWADLYVESLTTKELVVRSAGKASDTVFDYVVNGLRLGHEEVSIVQEKQEEARIPAIMAFHQGQYVQYPELREYSALSRFQAMHADVSGSASPMNFAASDALRAAVEVYDPAVHGPVGTPHPEEPGIEPRATATMNQPEVPLGDARATAAPSTGAPSIPMDAEGNVYGKSFRPSASDVAGVMPAGEPLEPGDVVVFDGAIPGELRRGRDAGDPAVAGCIVAEPGLLLGASRVDEGGTAALATSGMVRCRADAGYGAIAVGDLLTVSATPGHAMRAADPRTGTILGKAVEPLAAGAGLIKVLVMLR